MIDIDGVLVSDDIGSKHFVCDLEKCKGGCCVEGELGAPLEKEELGILDDIHEKIKPYLSNEGRKAIEEQGNYILDSDVEYSTPTINGKECAYSVYEKGGILKCGIEKAFIENKTNFRKPISCHLYPARVSKVGDSMAINYHQWEICNPACKLGSELKVPLYKFLKLSLMRKFGKAWYNKLEAVMKDFLKMDAN